MPTRAECYGQLAHLPPLDAWLQNPEKVKKFYAPVDDRGFVLHDATIEKVLELFDDDYSWPVDWSKQATQIWRPDDHHFQWFAALYESSQFQNTLKKCDIPKRFRNLPTNRGLLPRQFHNVLHDVTRPPRVPKLGRMEQYLRSHEIACQLFLHAERAMALERLVESSEDEQKLEKYIRQYERVFEKYSSEVYQALGIDAFHMIGIQDEFDPHSYVETHQLLGLCALLTVPNYTNQYFPGVSAESVALAA